MFLVIHVGEVSEGSGEDAYLGSQIAKAMKRVSTR
jgi:hypothetical protein